jgi:hypothetical protein
MFSIQIDLFVGIAVGYMHLYGLLKQCEMSLIRAKSWESRVPFKYVANTQGKQLIVGSNI